MAIYNLDLDNDNLKYVRDGFCLSCFTGLRYSDLAKLKKSNITDNEICVVTQKTTDIIHININKFSKSILERYKEMDIPNDMAIPVLCNQIMNRMLKTIGKLAGIDSIVTTVEYRGNERIEKEYHKWELLTTHCGRRTFVVNAMTLEIPESVIMSWTGHKDNKAMKPYKKVVDKLKETQMDKFNSLDM